LGRRENAKNYSGFARYKFSGFEIYTTCKKHPIDGGSANMINYTEITPGD
jgi:hypothetical protein